MDKHVLAFYQLNFTVQESLLLAHLASVQRAYPYTGAEASITTAATNCFRVQITAFFEQELLPMYLHGCPEAQHVANLLRLVDFGTEAGGALFDQRGYRLANAQKYLNLLLKYLWTQHLIARPPHCPVDRILLQKAGMGSAKKWTEMTVVGDYLAAIDALASIARADGLSLAEWELREYQRRNPISTTMASRLMELQEATCTLGENSADADPSD